MTMVKTELGISSGTTLTLHDGRCLTMCNMATTDTIRLYGDLYGKSYVAPRAHICQQSTTPTYGSCSGYTNAMDTVAGYEWALNNTGTPSSQYAMSRPKASPGTANSMYNFYSFGAGTRSGTLYICLDGNTTATTSIDTSNYVTSDVTVYYTLNSTVGPWYSFGSISAGGSWSKSVVSVFLSNINLGNLGIKIDVNSNSAGNTVASYAGAFASANVYDIIFL